jgi:isopenicillin N synthase-like dioxygenase
MSAYPQIRRLREVRSVTTATVPVIDISHLSRDTTLRAIDAACRDWGFFQATGHGISARTIAALKREMRAFFALPLETKRAIVRTAENPWGFYDQELTRRTRDWKQIYDYGPPDDDVLVPQWPSALPGFRAAIEAFYAACDAVALRLLHAIALNLGMPATALDGAFRPEHTSFLRLNYYPRCPRPERPEAIAVATEGFLGVNHHTDSGVLTLLLQDEQPGLEVLQNGSWHLVEPRRDALVVNIGDIVQVWSNDRYRAALHRGLVAADAERFSAPFFFNPAYSAAYAPLPSTVDSQHPPLYRQILWREFRARRAAGDYADHGEYAQISDYRA